ncbi:glycosyltransferase [Clostridium estertheticum]|uniref:glycosyltransferase n=1 Tax=Clostridium estertheticum TaxID=238834 RepID=UPI001CF44368|nr:glycosyltransferase [Clostridium estertheticum]MCB2306815.1 glycosyltransferase [Clostridium estertheticum]MCB2347026.1 glycosyltransferase [Clostridium estertheticum]MCB2350321.1 glycosyltransferase [Clostridium estertheticum]WAG47288.1 glycosyltransferase [Clostridium estertheticum]
MEVNKQQLVSVIMSVYNEKEKWLMEAIESILNQSYRRLEFIIILDNPENKKLENIIKFYNKKDARIRFFKNEKNIGLVRSLNKALTYVKGDFIARMDADDISLVGRIDKQIEYLGSHPDVDFMGARCINIDEDGKELYRDEIMPVDMKLIKSCLLNVDFINHPTWFFRKECIDKNEGYREITCAEDYDFLLRLITNGFKLGTTNEFLVRYRIRKSGISKSNSLQQLLYSKHVVKMYKDRVKYGHENETVEDLKNIKINVHEEKRYSLALEGLTKSKLYKNKNQIYRIYLILKSCIRSKYLRILLKDITFHKVKKLMYIKKAN